MGLAMNNYSTTQQKRIIHMLIKQYNITDDEYRELLQDRYDVNTSVDLTEKEAENLIHYLNYSYDDSYKLGYDNGYKKFMEVALNSPTNMFNTLIKIKYNRDITEPEKKMFNLLPKSEQRDLLKSLF